MKLFLIPHVFFTIPQVAQEADKRAHSGRPETSLEEFSLRRFFEAGGRDYADYLDMYNKAKALNCYKP